MQSIIAILMQIIALLPKLIAAGVVVEGLIQRVTNAVNSGSTDPSDAQWAAVNTEIAELLNRLDADPPAPAPQPMTAAEAAEKAAADAEHQAAVKPKGG